MPFFLDVTFRALRRRCHCFTIILLAGKCKAVYLLMFNVCSGLLVGMCWQPM